MKKKKPLSERLPAPLFIVLVMLVQAFGLGAGIAIYNTVSQTLPLQELLGAFFFLAGAIPSILVVLGESLLYKLQFRWSASKWFRASLIGLLGFYGWGIVQGYLFGTMPPIALLSILNIVPILIFSSAQSIVLRQYVKRAWLWILAILVTNTLAPLLYNLLGDLSTRIDALSGMGSISTSLVAAIQGLFLGTVLTILVRLSIADERQEAESRQDSTEDSSRLEDVASQDIESMDEQMLKREDNTSS